MARKSTTPTRRVQRSSALALAFGCAGLLAAVGSAPAHLNSDTAGHTTVEQTIVGGDPAEGFQTLRLGPGENYVVREDLAEARDRRDRRRRSLAYFGQITDFQLADEESPAREERTDSEPFRRGLTSSGYRPQEALAAHAVELTIRQMNRFVRSPVPQGDGNHARMLNAVMTGDLADNMQHNETQWVMRLLEGGRLDPNSGTTDFSGTYCEGLSPEAVADGDDPSRYTGVQDYDDYSPDNPLYYDPEHPTGGYSDWPAYPGLLDRAQRPFRAAGLKVPTYVAFGNHDGLYQGTVSVFPPILSSGATFEQPAVDCLKPVYVLSDQDAAGGVLSVDYLAGVFASDPGKVMLVPPDQRRHFVDHEQFKAIFDPEAEGSSARQDDAHGFAHVNRKQLTASDGYAAYYSFRPAPGIRYVVLDTLAQAGVLASPSESGGVADGSKGNIDDPQFEWLKRKLRHAERKDQLVIAFGHHARTSLTMDIPDEANPCTGALDEHGHDTNPSCDGDPRSSSPVHDGNDLIELFLKHPNVVAYVAGHSHENEISPYCEGTDPNAPLEPPCKPQGAALWEVKSPATADWPPQHRVIDVMDNGDGTLSIFATSLDHAGPAGIPKSGSDAGGFGKSILAAIGRVLTYNDPGERANHAQAVGTPKDRNVELLLDDPRNR